MLNTFPIHSKIPSSLFQWHFKSPPSFRTICCRRACSHFFQTNQPPQKQTLFETLLLQGFPLIWNLNLPSFLWVILSYRRNSCLHESLMFTHTRRAFPKDENQDHHLDLKSRTLSEFQMPRWLESNEALLLMLQISKRKTSPVRTVRNGDSPEEMFKV